MVISNYTAFLGIAALVIVTPGQDTALVVRNTLAVLGATFCGMTFVWLTLYAFAVERAGQALGGSRLRRALEAALGVTLVALGLRLASERR